MIFDALANLRRSLHSLLSVWKTASFLATAVTAAVMSAVKSVMLVMVIWIPHCWVCVSTLLGHHQERSISARHNRGAIKSRPSVASRLGLLSSSVLCGVVPSRYSLPPGSSPALAGEISNGEACQGLRCWPDALCPGASSGRRGPRGGSRVFSPPLPKPLMDPSQTHSNTYFHIGVI